MANITLIISIFFILHTYFIYPLLLIILNYFNYNKLLDKKCDKQFFMSIIIAVHNEERRIENRLHNLFNLNYDKNKYEIIVASDGSTDNTIKLVKKYNDLKLLDFLTNRGRAITHNDAIHHAKGDIVIFTDAGTSFDKDFVKKLNDRFLDETTGCVVGNLIYKISENTVSNSESFYWRFEKQLRQLESNLNMLSTSSGACMAVRKKLWRKLDPIDDCDFTTPLDVILQNHKVKYAPDAYAYDEPPSTLQNELQTRIRQTSKNFMGTLKRWGWRGWLQHPIISFGLLSHKILRWLTPFFMIAIFISNLIIYDQGSFYNVLLYLQISFYLLALSGLIMYFFDKKYILPAIVFNFCLANIGMAVGVIKGLAGRAPVKYKPSK